MLEFYLMGVVITAILLLGMGIAAIKGKAPVLTVLGISCLVSFLSWGGLFIITCYFIDKRLKDG